MKTSTALALATGMFAFALAGTASAQIGTFTGTTCAELSSVNDLSSGVYVLLGRDVTYPRTLSIGSATLTPDAAGPPLVLAVCLDPPSPTANCTALEAPPGAATSWGFVPTRPTTATNVWIVVDALRSAGTPQDCGSYTLTITGPLG